MQHRWRQQRVRPKEDVQRKREIESEEPPPFPESDYRYLRDAITGNGYIDAQGGYFLPELMSDDVQNQQPIISWAKSFMVDHGFEGDTEMCYF